jgi:L-threonylcarbamoyladenylate synthase
VTASNRPGPPADPQEHDHRQHSDDLPRPVEGLVRDASDAAALEAAAAVLLRGGIVGLPTETVYGLAVLPTATAVAALIAAKRRAPEKGIALLIDSLEQARALAVVPAAAEALAARFWPGALTIVLPLLPDVELPDAITGGRRSIGLRLPDHAVPRHLARRLGPLAVSSENLSGEPEARSAGELLATVGASLALILDGGPVRGGVPSTVVAVTPGQPLRVLREGAIPNDLLRAEVGGGVA